MLLLLRKLGGGFPVQKQNYDLIIIGGGIMGLFTAYYAAQLTSKILIIEKEKIGNKNSGSNGLTRSIRNDYLDPLYVRFSQEARKLWEEFQWQSSTKVIINCGVLNIAKKSITPNLASTYAQLSFNAINSVFIDTKRLTGSDLKKQFFQFNADIGCLDVNAGFIYVPRVMKSILAKLKKCNVKILENVEIELIESGDEKIYVKTNIDTFVSKKLVVTAGIGSNEVINLIKGAENIKFPIILDKPIQSKYYIPSKDKEKMFRFQNMPVFAYLDVGIYGHPIYNRKTKGVKIGFYNPPDLKKQKERSISNIQNFVNECIPSLKDAKVIDVTDVDQCYYDLVEDNDFILGELPEFSKIFVGTGFKGTGYKFAPLIGKILSQLALQQGTVYDIQRFSPGRFSNKIFK